jgi:hypothetical protein
MIAYPTVSARAALAAYLCGLIMGMATIVAAVPGAVQVMRACQ